MQKNKFLLLCQLGRLNNLNGAWLLLLPSFWSLAVNVNSYENIVWILYLYLCFFVGAICMRAFGCVVNDLVDIKIDKQVERTKTRPLASGQLTKKDAILALIMYSILPIIILLSFDNKTKLVALASLFLVVLYPFTKRFFALPQLILGLTFNWGIILASYLVNQKIGILSIILYVISIIWTVAYDTIYAYQDYNDDRRMGINSSAVVLGEEPFVALFIMYIVVLIGFVIVGAMLDLTMIYYSLLAIAGVYLLVRLRQLNYKNKKRCFRFFVNNVYFAWAVWVALILGKVI